MGFLRRRRRMALGCAAALALAACTSQVEPAQRSISDIATILAAATPEASTYAADQLADVQRRLGALQTSFDQHDYAAVLAAAPDVMSAAQALAAAAAERKREIARALDEEWAVYAAVVPDEMTAIRNRIDQPVRKAGKKPAVVPDLDAARERLSADVSLWSKAQAGFATGNLAEAVATAHRARIDVDDLARALDVPLVDAPMTPH